MEDVRIQMKLLRFIADYNDGKISFQNSDGKELDNKKIKDGIGHPDYIGVSLKIKFIDKLKYDKDEINDNLRLLSEDNKIKILPKEGSYLETENPIFLTSIGYKEFSLFKRYPLASLLGFSLMLISIINGIISILKTIKHAV